MCVAWAGQGRAGRPNWLIYMLCHARLARRHSPWHGMPTDRPSLKASAAYRIASEAHNEARRGRKRWRWRWRGGVTVQDLGGDESRIKYQFRLSVRLFRCPLSFIRQPQRSHQIANNFLYYKTAYMQQCACVRVCVCVRVCLCYVLQLPAAAYVVAYENVLRSP